MLPQFGKIPNVVIFRYRVLSCAISQRTHVYEQTKDSPLTCIFPPNIFTAFLFQLTENEKGVGGGGGGSKCRLSHSLQVGDI